MSNRITGSEIVTQRVADELDASAMETAANRALGKHVRRFAGWTLAAYWIALFASTHVRLPKNALPRDSDKLAHFLAYGGLAVLLGGWLSGRGSLGARRVAGAFVVLAAYGVFDELSQPLVGRTGDVLDALADWIGAALGLSAIWLAAAMFRWNRPSSQVVADAALADRGGGGA